MSMLWVIAGVALGAEPELSGTWVLAEDWETVKTRHTEAVKQAVAQLPWAFRPVARPLLEKSVWSCGKLDVGLTEERFRAKCDEKDPFEMERSKPEDSITGDDGKPYAVTLKVGDDRASVRFEGAQGGQENTYAVDEEHLVVTREMFSPQLPKPVRWTVRYERK